MAMDSSRDWVVHKFGGSSVADATCMEQVGRIVEADVHPRVAVVLSACKGVTDALLALVSAAEEGNESVRDHLAALRTRHLEIAQLLLDERNVNRYAKALDSDCRDISGILQTASLIRSASPAMRDVVIGFGEVWSSRLFHGYLSGRGRRPGEVRWLDARQVVYVEHTGLGPAVAWSQSRAALEQIGVAGSPLTLVITGFIAREVSGLPTTLGRNGSDFSASIFGNLLNASEILIWTDVNGVMSADPRRVPEATVIDALSYREAMELAYFGAKVIHPQTMTPAVEQRIPIRIKNTFAPGQPGTLISERPDSTNPVKGIATIDRVALVNVEGTGMIGVPGTAQRLFGALREQEISVILISQGSSEHSICFAVPQPDARRTERTVRRTFEAELRQGQIQRVEVDDDCSILAVVGDGMAGTPGVAAKVFSALGNAGVNIRAIAQGASERNISLVVDQGHAARALGSVHSGFYLSPYTISLGLIGPGLVGSALMEQLASQTARLASQSKVDIRLRGVMSSRQMLLGSSPIPFDSWKASFAQSSRPPDPDLFRQHIRPEHLPNAVIVDCSASAEIAAFYPRWLAAGIHVVTPNKKANSSTLDFYDSLKESQRAGRSHYLYEATVGAGLPVIQTLRDLRHTGDAIRAIDGILSGTLAYLFNTFDGGRPFSQIVEEARAKGYTEPDPRDDLSGTDVARKLIILAREMGLRLEMSDVLVESLVPDALAEASPEEFLARLPEFDAVMAERLRAAQRAGRVLRYVGRLDAATSRAEVGLMEVERTDALANANLTDNVVRFHTRRYDENPLVVQGPGAGPDVTAGGVFADLLRVCAYLGAPL